MQWLAPLASEAPELLIAGLYAWRLNTNAGLGTLVSSKVNQWTLLVGTLPIVFSIAAGGLHGLPIEAQQREELFLTAAQSFFAVAILSNLSMSIREAWLLFGLFWAQFIVGAIVPESWHAAERIGVGILYMVLGLRLFIGDRARLPEVAARRVQGVARRTVARPPTTADAGRTPGSARGRLGAGELILLGLVPRRRALERLHVELVLEDERAAVRGAHRDESGDHDREHHDGRSRRVLVERREPQDEVDDDEGRDREHHRHVPVGGAPHLRVLGLPDEARRRVARQPLPPIPEPGDRGADRHDRPGDQRRTSPPG